MTIGRMKASEGQCHRTLNILRALHMLCEVFITVRWQEKESRSWWAYWW